MIDSLTSITGNPEKAGLLSQYLAFPVVHRPIDLMEIQSLDGAEIIEYKAKEAYKQVGSPVLVEDKDAIFIPAGYDKTWAEMTDEESQAMSMRKITLKKTGNLSQAEIAL